MFLIVIIAFIATVGFFRKAKEIDVHAGKAANIPFIGAGLMIAVTYLFATVIGRLFSATKVSTDAAAWLGSAMDWFLLLAYLFYVKRNWDILTSSDTRDPMPETNDNNVKVTI